MKKIAIYPGSFDPITNGHLDIIKRSAEIFDEVIVLVSLNPNKSFRFTLDEKMEMIEKAIKDIPNAKVDHYEGLIVNYAKAHHAKTLIRGLRVVSDFEYEWGLFLGNKFIDPSIDIVFLMSRKEYSFISSSAIMEFYHNNVDITSLVPQSVIEVLSKKKSQ